ncbi:MAG: hypothetical protein E6J86_11570 [Deltaproteobacteria bacterium]|nr:MAG: hypothetical protein E6J86_11570 [Deltaproteobacteria bacterium]
MHRRSDLGITFITVLLFAAALAAVLVGVTYGEAYWENLEVKRVLKEAANLSYREADDRRIREYVFKELHHVFDQKVEDHGRVITEMKIDVDDGDLRIERTQVPSFVHIWLTYSRDVQVPLLHQQRRVTFNEYAEQDLSPVKW